MRKSPLPLAPSTMFAAGTRAFSKMISALEVLRWPDLLIILYQMPGVPRSTTIADRPSLPPARESVRTTIRLRFAPLPSQPATLHGQYLRPFRT